MTPLERPYITTIRNQGVRTTLIALSLTSHGYNCNLALLYFVLMDLTDLLKEKLVRDAIWELRCTHNGLELLSSLNQFLCGYVTQKGLHGTELRTRGTDNDKHLECIAMDYLCKHHKRFWLLYRKYDYRHES